MRNLPVAFAGVVVAAGLMSLPAAAQTEPEPAPRTAWGQPDLGGVWEYKTRTPLERPERFEGREFLTAEEAAEIEENERARIRAMEERPAQRTVAIPTAGERPGRWLDSPDHPSLQGQTGSYNIFWFDWGTGAVSTGRTSLIVDPPNGRMPALTEAGRERARTMGARSSFSQTVESAESHLDFSNSDRCLMSGNAGPPMLPGVYNNNMQLFQTPDHVAIMNEMMHTVRVIPLDGRPAPAGGIRQYVGDSRGRWEGDHPGGRDGELQRRPHPQHVAQHQPEPHPGRAFHSRRRRDPPLRVHGDRPRHLGAAVGRSSCPCSGAGCPSSSSRATRATTASRTSSPATAGRRPRRRGGRGACARGATLDRAVGDDGRRAGPFVGGSSAGRSPPVGVGRRASRHWRSQARSFPPEHDPTRPKPAGGPCPSPHDA